MTPEATAMDTVNERLATLAGAIDALEAAIATTDKALLATSTEDLSKATAAQSQAATRTLALKQQLQQSLSLSAAEDAQSSLENQLQAHPNAAELVPQFKKLETRLKTSQISLVQQAQVVNKMQAINRQLLGVLADVDNHSYNQLGGHNDSTDGQVIARV